MTVEPSNPVRYSTSVEHPEADEAKSAASVNDSLMSIAEITSKDYGHAVRSVHAKAHGLVRGRLEIVEGLSPLLAQGLFATPGSYDAVMRISTAPGDILEDSISSPRGVALKIIGVTGDRLPGSESDSTQDFVMVNGPAFGAPGVKQFSAVLKTLATTTDKSEGLKVLVSGALQAVESVIEAVGGASPALQTLGGAPNTHPLGETYYGQAPFRYGDHIVKFSLAPVTPNLTELKGMKVNTSDRPDALRDDLSEVFIEGDSEWALRVQFCTDLDAMPVEDASKIWSEKNSPWLTVARLIIPRQASWQGADTIAEEDQLSFSPWHGLAAHQPLGSVNRARKDAYTMSAEFRGKFNGCPISEPKA